MKKSLALLLLFIIFNCSISPREDYFEGIITYKLKSETYENKHDDSYGDTLIYFTKDGFIKRVYKNSKTLVETIYNPKDNKMYSLVKGIDTLFCHDMIVNPASLINLKFDKVNEVKFLDNDCNKMVVDYIYKYDGDEFAYHETYYFSPALKLNPSYFKNYKLAFWDKISAATNSFYLYYEQETAATKMTLEAIRVDRKKLNNDIFQIRADLPIKQLTL